MQPVVVLSDIHLGQSEHSLLKGTEVYKLFFEEMNALREKHGDPKFVLAGDVFDLWRDYAKNAIPLGKDLFKGMSDLTKKESDVVYVPGNHDHFIKLKMFGDPLYGKTNMADVDPGKSDTLKALKDYKLDFKVEYPDHTFKFNGKKVCVTHGHFLTEEIGVDSWFIRFYLLWAKFWHLVTTSREGLEKRKIKTYERIFKHLVKRFSSEKKKKTYKKAGKPMFQKKYDFWDSRKLRNNWEIMNMKRKRWKATCDIYIAGHTHLPGLRDPSKKYNMPYLNSGAVHASMATYLVLFEKKAEIRNIGNVNVCRDYRF